jgi:hypothetical protein
MVSARCAGELRIAHERAGRPSSSSLDDWNRATRARRTSVQYESVVYTIVQSLVCSFFGLIHSR